MTDQTKRAEIPQQAHDLFFKMLMLGPLGERVPGELLPILATALEQAYKEGTRAMLHTIDALEGAGARIKELEAGITGIVQWLEANQPDVFARGLWDIPVLSKSEEGKE
jgi:hypothetical protein